MNNLSYSGAMDLLISVSYCKQNTISQQPHKKQGKAKRLGVVSSIRSLCPNEHCLPTPVRQGARWIKNSEETSSFQMTECTVVTIGSEIIFLPLFYRMLIYSLDWSHWRTEEGCQLVVQSRTVINSV